LIFRITNRSSHDEDKGNLHQELIASRILRHMERQSSINLFLPCRTMWVLVFAFTALLQAHAQKKSIVHTEVHRLFIEDQKNRNGDSQDWKQINIRDKQRRNRVRSLLDSGMLKTGQDYSDAAFIFQHGDDPDDFLLAHILAVIGISKGNLESRWIAAATLDRYLDSLSKPQVFGTQYNQRSETAPFTQEPFDRKLLTDGLRLSLCVPGLKAQSKVLDSLAKNEQPNSPKVCK
jgi:hypothetical protein